MEKSFWINKWDKDETGFHLERVNPQLERYYTACFPLQEMIFVPLAGKTLDMLFLANQGHHVIAVELSEKAVKAFFAENELEFEQHSKAEFQCYSAQLGIGKIDILVGDFFELTPEHLDGCRAIYDRAALIALTPEQRQNYVKKLFSLFPQLDVSLLVTLSYPQSQMSGPPFSVAEEEVKDLFLGCEISQLYQRDILSMEPRFQEKGLAHLNETVFRLSWGSGE